MIDSVATASLDYLQRIDAELSRSEVPVTPVPPAMRRLFQVHGIGRFAQRERQGFDTTPVQRGDLPKVEITREGAVWYNPRSALKGAVGVLYPDMTKMTTFEARY